MAIELGKTTGALTAAGTLDGTELFHVVDTDGNSRKLTLADLKTFVNTDPTVVPSSEPAKLLRVQRTSNQSLSNASTTAISWQSSQKDTSGGQLSWSVGTATRITIGAGVTKVIARASLAWAANGTGARLTIIRKGGSTMFGEGYDARLSASASIPTIAHAETVILDVAENDYLEVFGHQASGGALNMQNGNNTWFEVEIVEASV